MTPTHDTRPDPDPRAQLSRRRAAAVHRRRRRRALAVAAIVLVSLVLVTVALARPGRGDRVPTAETAGPAPNATTTGPSPSADRSGATAAKDDTVVEIGWVGDLTPGSQYGSPPDGGRALFEYTRTYTSKPDVMVANLEGTFGEGGPSKCDGRDASACYAFQAPQGNAKALAWAGIDVVNMANNHSYDYFAAGAKATKQALDANGIDYTGLVGDVAVKEVDGVRVAFVGFSPYSRSPNIGDLAAAKDLVKRVHENADIVVVLMHAGAEGADKIHTPEGGETAYGEFRGDSRAFSHAVIDAGADLVLGSGPHVVRGLEEYRGRLVAYSLGNFAGWKNFSRKGNLALSGLLTVRVAGDGRVLGGRWLSLRIADPGVPKVDPDGASAALVRRLSTEDFKTPVKPAEDGTFVLGAQ